MQETPTERIAAIVVTYNRHLYLQRCLKGLLNQSRSLERIFIIDNASNDGTADVLKNNGYLSLPAIEYVQLEENLGGAGGFHQGLKRAYASGFDWFWLLDDDANPAQDALAELLASRTIDDAIYGSVTLADGSDQPELCWPPKLESGETVTFRDELIDASSSVATLPFISFLIGRDLVGRIGYPDASYFIAGDDVEYCQRALKAGAQLILVKESIVFHPLPVRQVYCVMGKSIYTLSLPPWKNYYDIRNRILTGRRHYGVRLWTQTLPGIFVRFVVTLFHTDLKWQQFKAYLKAIIDGLIDRRGRRVLP